MKLKLKAINKILDQSGLSYFKTKFETWVNNTFLKKSDYEAPTIKVVKLNGHALNADEAKAVNIDLSTYAIKTEVTHEITQAVSGIKSFEAQVVEQLPESGKNGILYLVANKSEDEQNIYDEFLWVNGKYEHLGNRKIDLSQYALKTEIPTKVSQLANDSGFLTEVPSEYVTDSELIQKGYQTSEQVNTTVTEATQDMATNSSIDTKLEGYMKSTDLQTITNQEIDSLFN